MNLPYVLSESEFNRRYDLLLSNLSSKQLIYFEKMRERKNYWARAFNKEDSLGSHCTGMVENINRLHKAHVGLKCGLTEYLYRTIMFSGEFNNKNGISGDDILQFNAYFDLVKGSSYVLRTKDHITSFALQTIVINMIKSFSWKPSENGMSVYKADNSYIQYGMTQEENIFFCSCGYQKILKLPCEHILRVLTEQKKEDDILAYIDMRWRETISFAEKDEVLEELIKMIDEGKHKGNSQNSQLKLKDERL